MRISDWSSDVCSSDLRLDVLGPGYLGHRQLVLGALFVLLEGGGAEEEHLAVLDRRHPADRERATVAGAVDLVDDRMLDVARAQEVGVQRVRVARLGQRRLRRRQRLTQHLPAANALGADGEARAAGTAVPNQN